MKQPQRKTLSAAAMRKKLFSAAAMLLVASIMLVSTSYAWLVLSTAPEITGISTQVGANGALEIALLNTESYNDLSMVVEADIDESLGDAVPAVTTSNLSWGNLIGLGDESYGLSQITLNPSRLNISPDGDTYKINSVLLKTPVYNEDGRIVKLEQTAVTSVYDAGKFPASGEANYGVRAIGVAADMNEAQLGINAARAALATNMAAARTVASKTLNAQGNALGNVAVGVALGSASGFTVADVTAMRDLAIGLQTAMGNIDTAVRQVYLAYVYSLGLGEEELAAAITEIEEASSLSIIKARYPEVTMPMTEGDGDIVDLLVSDQAKVQGAIDSCNEKINSGQASFTEDEILAVMRPLVEYEQMTMGGYSMSDLRNMSQGELINVVLSGGGLTVSVPTGSGILSDISDFAGNYTAEVTVEQVSYGGVGPMDVTATMATSTTVNPVYLTQCSNMMRDFTVADGGSGGTVITDFYGYAIDLAFRTNASSDRPDGLTDLQLQTESTQRIYDESDNAATQGGGSYMTFNSDLSGLSATKMIKLMSGIRVVFMDQEQQVLAIAALDTTLGQDAYVTGASTYTVKNSVVVGETTVMIGSDTCLEYTASITKAEYDELDAATALDETSGKYQLGKDAYQAEGGVTIPEGKYAALNYDNPQKSDYITKAEYDALAGNETAVSVAADGSVTAKLYLYDFHMVVSTAHEDTENTYYTGAIALGNKLDSSAITTLEENVPKQVTTMVYLDGSVVNNSMVAANSSYSMTGMMNLQFSSSANLVPMNNQALFDGEES